MRPRTSTPGSPASAGNGRGGKASARAAIRRRGADRQALKQWKPASKTTPQTKAKAGAWGIVRRAGRQLGVALPRKPGHPLRIREHAPQDPDLASVGLRAQEQPPQLAHRRFGGAALVEVDGIQGFG